ncbi:MAG: exodeoxyribonuclease V subunit alpha [Candidatus Sericytochromatia bacterium]
MISTAFWKQLGLLQSAGRLRFNELDLALARLIGKLAGPENCQELLLAILLTSSQSAAQHACADLEIFAAQPLDPDEPASQCFPPLDAWCAALAACPSVIAGPEDAYDPARPLILAGNSLYLARYWHYEQELAQWLLPRLGASEAVPLSLLPRLDQLFGTPGGALGTPTDWQRVAAVSALASRFCVISGGPGTGKTTTVAKLLVLLLEANPELRIALAAPTGKAAARLREALKRSLDGMDFLPESLRDRLLQLPATTLHRLLGARWGSTRFRHGHELPLDYDLILVDEALMIDLALMVKLLWAIPDSARLILLGDKDQLASVEAGCVLGDLCGLAQGEAFGPERLALLRQLAPGNYVPATGPLDDNVVLLKTSWRFAAGGGIGQLARAIQAGDAAAATAILNDGEQADVGWQALPAAAELEAALIEPILAGYAEYLQASEPAEALACWERFMLLATLRGGPFGVEELNRTIESLLARAGAIRTGDSWYHRRPILIAANDEAQQLFNGDIGVVWRGRSGTRVWFQHADGRLRDFTPARLGRHESAWAMTIHKSQGSEFDRILMLLPEHDSPLLTRELIYTGLTRARRTARIWGPPELLEIAVKRRIQRASGLQKYFRGTGGAV